jgi:hypothetical protein
MPILYSLVLDSLLPVAKIYASGYFPVNAYTVETTVAKTFVASPLLVIIPLFISLVYKSKSPNAKL